jgi:hypothetical protein
MKGVVHMDLRHKGKSWSLKRRTLLIDFNSSFAFKEKDSPGYFFPAPVGG